jgi:nucleotide-binding universal stress UspA family protein
VDGSKRAEKIFPYVEDLAHMHESTLIFLQVVEPSTSIGGAYDDGLYIDHEKSDRIAASAKSYLACRVGEMREKGVAAKAVVEFGSVVRTIMDVAEREHADLIAMASHGRTGLSRVFFGSVAAGILHQVDRPLLLIHAGD